MLTFQRYQHEIRRTYRGIEQSPSAVARRLNCLALGMVGEAGEVCDLVKKVQHSGHTHDDLKLKRELGDVMWQVAFGCNVLSWSMASISMPELRLRSQADRDDAPDCGDMDAFQAMMASAAHAPAESRYSVVYTEDAALNREVMALSRRAQQVCSLVEEKQLLTEPLDFLEMSHRLRLVLCSVAQICIVQRWQLSDVALHNVAKLRVRYPSGFSPEASMTRPQGEANITALEAAERARITACLQADQPF